MGDVVIDGPISGVGDNGDEDKAIEYTSYPQFHPYYVKIAKMIVKLRWKHDI